MYTQIRTNVDTGTYKAANADKEGHAHRYTQSTVQTNKHTDLHLSLQALGPQLLPCLHGTLLGPFPAVLVTNTSLSPSLFCNQAQFSKA